MYPLQWTRPPKTYSIGETIEIVTEPHTDLWQRTYYHFRNDNAPLLQMETEEPYFTFTVKTDFSDSHQRFDQCGVVLYLDSENWLKASVEYENDRFQHLGSVVTNHGYSDWATTEIPAECKTMWYRLSRREDDYCLSAPKTARPSARCGSAISTRAAARFASASTPAPRRIPPSAPSSPTSTWAPASGSPTTANSPTNKFEAHFCTIVPVDRPRRSCGNTGTYDHEHPTDG